MKKNNKKGFTLAELLIVVAIIAVLVAIAIPVFTSQLEKSRESTDLANVRSAYAAGITKVLEGTSQDVELSVSAQQKVAGWQNTGSDASTTTLKGMSGDGEYSIEVPAKLDTYTITINSQSGDVTIS